MKEQARFPGNLSTGALKPVFTLVTPVLAFPAAVVITLLALVRSVGISFYTVVILGHTGKTFLVT